MLKIIFSATLATLLSCSAMASEDEARMVSTSTINEMQEFFPSMRNCNKVLNKSWDTFSGRADFYTDLEKEYQDGANQATLCGLHRGYLTYRFLGALENVKSDATLKKLGSSARIAEADKRFRHMLIDKERFMQSVDCTARTPKISFGNYFVQHVQITCSTNLGPVEVNLKSMHITVAGKDMWNGPTDLYFGRSFRQAL